MKKITSVFVALGVSLILIVSCKKSKDTPPPTLTLALNNLNYSAINSCSWRDGINVNHTGTPNNLSFTVTDASGLLKSYVWQLFEQVGTNPGYNIGSGTLNGTTLSFTGCITFGSDAIIPAKYYIVCNGVSSNTAAVTYNRPAGAL
jgi:hypothetical protein